MFGELKFLRNLMKQHSGCVSGKGETGQIDYERSFLSARKSRVEEGADMFVR